jgi:putative FmdB family regulatory protein
VPLYEYECEACGQRFEVIRKFSDPPLEICTLCGKGPVIRQVSSPAFQFKGTGWYITDYAKKGEASKGDGAKADGKSDAGKAGAKSESTKSDSGSADFLTKSDSKSDTTAKSEPAAPAAPAKSSGSAKD